MASHCSDKIMRNVLILAVCCMLPTAICQGQMLQIYENGPVHEAFVTRVSGEIVLQAAPTRPPDPVTERIPKQTDLQAVWIPGYWAWETSLDDFVWVSGAWRRPPPGHQWVSGFWKNDDEGWVWMPGFWSRTPQDQVMYIGAVPPDPIDENTAPPPGERHFWSPGYWLYLVESHDYQWVPGRWEELDPNWVLVPAHYVWRPNGYVFVPAFWDWNLDERGTAYASVNFDQDYRYRASFEPYYILKPQIIVRNLFTSYPDYITFFNHHWHYHQDYWRAYCCTPPWWAWDTWWGFTWHDQWGLWWWYGHPGYPQPRWLTGEISGILPPPLPELTAMFSRAAHPAIITPNGVVTRDQLFAGIQKSTARFAPVLPSEAKFRAKAYLVAKPAGIDPRDVLKPSGRRLPLDPKAVRPHVRKPIVESEAIGRVRVVSSQPKIPSRPRIPSNVRAPLSVPGRDVSENQDRSRSTWSPRPEGEMTARDTQVNDKGETQRKWRQMTPYSEPSMKRPSMHKSRQENSSNHH